MTEDKGKQQAVGRQLATWTGRFGSDYIERNRYEAWKLGPGTEAFRRMTGALNVQSILEVGANIGLNLLFLRNLFGERVKLHAVEPNKKAFTILTSNRELTLESALNCSGFDIPLPDSSIDLVFTSGVLIHVAPDDLGRITDEIVRVSRRYVLCSEYFSHLPEEKPYHGQSGLLFKRDFGGYYLDRFPQLETVDYGFLWQREFIIFDDINWWLFEKRLIPA